MENAIQQAIVISKNQVLLFAKGIILGISIIIPGISGGTIMMAFGMYEKMLEDLLKFYIRPYISMGFGSLIGIFGGSYIFSFLLQFHRNPTFAFILGCLLMSIPFILKRSKGYTKKEILLFIIGCWISFGITKMPTMIQGESLNIFHVFIAGFISSSAMMIPGVSGSAILIILGIYENMLLIVNGFQLINLFIFIIGAILGLVILAKILKTLFTTYGNQILFFFSGLILGSSKMLFPSKIDFISVSFFLLGIGVVYKWGNFKYKRNSPLLGRSIRNIKDILKGLQRG